VEQHGERRAGEEPRRRAASAADEAKGIRVGTGEARRRLRGFGVVWCFRIRARESALSGPTTACLSVFPRGFVLMDRDLFPFGPWFGLLNLQGKNNPFYLPIVLI